MLGPFYSSEVLPPFLAEQASQTCWGSHPDLLNKPLRLAGQASLACRTSFLKRDGQVWAFVLTGGPREKMDPTFVGHVDVLDLPTGPLGLLGLISQFTQFTLFKFDIPNYKIIVTSRTAFPRFKNFRYNIKPLNKKDAMTLFCHSASPINIPEEYIRKVLFQFMIYIRVCARAWNVLIYLYFCLLGKVCIYN